MREYDLITSILGNFSRSKKQKNDAFACDAEIVSIGDRDWGITMDEFSPEEDMFGEMEAFAIGRNLATAVLSDLFACGAKPKFFMHSLVVGENTETDFINEMVKGVSSVLNSANCFLLGGDIGSGENWRYTGMAMGPVCGKRYLSRVLPVKEQALWVTGRLGDANLAAFTGKAGPLFELRLEEAQYICENATGCIDTSGGFVDSVWLLKTLNKDLRFEIDAASLPIEKDVMEFCKTNALPPEAFLFGGAGEYELLFTTALDTIPEIEATKVGNVCPSDEPGLFFDIGGRLIEMGQPPVCARETPDRNEYIQRILKQVNDVFG